MRASSIVGQPIWTSSGEARALYPFQILFDSLFFEHLASTSTFEEENKRKKKKKERKRRKVIVADGWRRRRRRRRQQRRRRPIAKKRAKTRSLFLARATPALFFPSLSPEKSEKKIKRAEIFQKQKDRRSNTYVAPWLLRNFFLKPRSKKRRGRKKSE